MQQDALFTATDFFRPFPPAEEVFSEDVTRHARFLLPIASLDLAKVAPELSGVVHFIQPVEPYDGVVGEGGDDYFDHLCRENWVGFQYDGNKCRLACDFRFFELARLESLPSRSQRQTELLDRYLHHYEDVHFGYEQARQHFLTHGALHPREEAPPFSEADRLELLKSLGGQSEQYSCNWAAVDDMPLTRHSDYHSVPRTADGRDFIFAGELSTPHYVWSRNYALGCELLLFYDPVSRVSLSTFDWS